jgi:putative membrane protein
MRSKTWTIALTALTAAGWGCARANDDADVARQAASTGMLEVELGSYAAANAESPAVKSFGSQMVEDHGKANQELASLAQRLNISLPATMNADQRAEATKLMALRGAEFDEAYLKAMVDGHKKVESAFSKQADQKKTEIDRWAASTLPTIRMHLDHAKQLESQQVSANQ